MKISVTINDSDYIRFNEYYMFNSSQGKKTLAMVKLVMPAVAIALIVLFVVLGVEKKLLIAEIAALVVASVIWVIKSPKYFLKELGKNIDKIKQDGKLPYTENAILEFGDDAIIETTESSMKKVSYADVSRIGITDEYIFIFFDAIQAFIIPKRCVADVQAELEKLLQEKVHC